MSYVDAFYEQGKDIVTVVERVDGKRIIKEVKQNIIFIMVTLMVNIKVFLVTMLLK
jgi:hypothetical protein